MLKPIINLEELEYLPDGENLPGKSSSVSEKIGAKKLGYNVSVCPPGKSTCPFHNHRVNEEMIIILEGEGLLRYGNKEFPLRKHDIVAFPPGDQSTAHQIINTGSRDLVYFCLSTKFPEEICEYPDSDKVGLFIDGDPNTGGRGFRKMFKSVQAVDYWTGESAECLKK